jgi:hypothetical protein
MREAIKVMWVVVFMIAAPAAAIAWIDDPPSTTAWVFRIGCPVLSVLGIGAFLKMHFRADIVPDYLRQHVGGYYNRDGFCFAPIVTASDGVCYMNAYFQNQRDTPCVGRIAIRPARGFFMNRADIDTIAINVICEPAAVGVARVALPVAAKLQGKRQSFEVGASVNYPQGKGCQLRFRDGVILRADSNFQDGVMTALAVGLVMTGHIVLTRPAMARMKLPTGVAEEIPDGLTPEIKTVWRLGDPPLQAGGW